MCVRKPCACGDIWIVNIWQSTLVLFTLVRAEKSPADHGLFCTIDHFHPLAILWSWNWHPRGCYSMPSLTCKAIPAHEHAVYRQAPVADPTEAVWRWHGTVDRQDMELTRPVAVLETSLSLQGRLYYQFSLTKTPWTGSQLLMGGRSREPGH